MLKYTFDKMCVKENVQDLWEYYNGRIIKLKVMF